MPRISIPNSILSQRRDQSIDELRANIERGHNVETSKRVLRAILRDNAGYHFVQSPEEERSEALQAMRNMPEFTAEDKVNLEAVIRDYDNGWLQCPPGGQGVVYFGGQRKTPYAVDVLDYPVVQKVDEWLAEGATGRMWIEQGHEMNDLLLSSTFFPPRNAVGEFLG